MVSPRVSRDVFFIKTQAPSPSRPGVRNRFLQPIRLWLTHCSSFRENIALKRKQSYISPAGRSAQCPRTANSQSLNNLAYWRDIEVRARDNRIDHVLRPDVSFLHLITDIQTPQMGHGLIRHLGYHGVRPIYSLYHSLLTVVSSSIVLSSFSSASVQFIGPHRP